MYKELRIKQYREVPKQLWTQEAACFGYTREDILCQTIGVRRVHALSRVSTWARTRLRYMRVTMACCLMLGMLAYSLVAAGSTKLLPQHQEWLDGPASILATKSERNAFSLLASDSQRDNFIEHFWAIRNPRPGGPNNEFKEEFFTRVAYANEFYGRDSGREGWRTDRGRTYILFGRPQTTTSFLAHQELYPTEMWFYSNPGLPELPPFFYAIFFERDGVSGYRLYNPVTDGPDKIMRAGPSKAQAFTYLRQLNPELAQASISYIPGETVDTDSYSGSMASITVVNAIQSYREMPSYKRLIAEREAQFEQVKTKLVYDVPSTSLEIFVALQNGEYWLHWRLGIQDPLQPKVKDGRVDFRIRAQLFSKDQLIYERTDTPGFAVPAAQAEALGKRPFAYEERFPIVPGEYRLHVTAENRAAGRSYESERPVVVGGPGKRTYLSDLLLASKRGSELRQVPFEFAGSRFDPVANGAILRTHPLNVLYLIGPAGTAQSEWDAEYAIGSATGKFRKTIKEKIKLGQADSGGVVLVTNSLPTEDLQPGIYMLALRLQDPSTGDVHGRSIRFQIIGTEEERPIVIAKPVQTGSQALAATHYEKALCWLSQQRPEEALREAEASWRLSQSEAARQLMQELQNQLERVVKN
jgi:GWxTD domain-containing protein